MVACQATKKEGEHLLDKKLLEELERYILLHQNSHYELYMQSPSDITPEELEEYIKSRRKRSFQQLLFQFIDSAGAADADIYKKAGIDRRHFSKIRSNSAYRPLKKTVLSFILALELNTDEAEELLEAAGYSFSGSEERDLVLQFFLENGIYDCDKINLALHHFQLEVL